MCLMLFILSFVEVSGFKCGNTSLLSEAAFWNGIKTCHSAFSKNSLLLLYHKFGKFFFIYDSWFMIHGQFSAIMASNMWCLFFFFLIQIKVLTFFFEVSHLVLCVSNSVDAVFHTSKTLTLQGNQIANILSLKSPKSILKNLNRFRR